ncbi:dTDP-4-dehydrorhamnose reductase [Euzebya pacifica]|uniref:dTDP-4-dehydrorhamnose reductase n=1 Tax=Euzebya pacifica TaxID=1608957 RepID=UPI0030FA9BEC
MKVLITGASGQLGHDLQRAFADDHVVALDRASLDVSREADVQAAVADHRPDLVVHSAAFTKVDACETESETAWRVNATASWWVARACETVDAAMVYISSDYVFDGSLGRPYTEFDTVNPRSMYGRSKEAGEQLVRRTLDRHYIVRTSWVHGADGGNFAKTMLRLGRERGAVSVVDDQTGSPTFTFDLAPQIRRLAATGRPGTYHLTNRGHCTWFEFAAAIFDGAGLDVDLTPTDTASFGAPAHRPAYSVLDNLMARQVGLPDMPHWQDSLKVLLQEIA